MPTPTLRELQGDFWTAITDPAGTPVVPALVAVVAPTERLAPAERVRIYADMYLGRLVEALREDFPQLASAFGCEGFSHLVGEYLGAHPSRSPSLRHLGTRLPDFLARERPDLVAEPLADLARLEWARVEAFDAPDSVPVGLAELRDVPPEAWGALRFRLVPGVSVVTSRWPVHLLWDDPTGSHALRPTAVRVWRQAFGVFHASIEPDEEVALRRLACGETFGALCELPTDDDPEVAVATAGALLARWLEDGLLVRM